MATEGHQLQLNDTDIGKDANVLILELNKGLQSSNLGEQCKAIAQFPNLLQKYPFPVVINSVFLKITQIFCDGNNYLRLCVLRACNSCRSHLEKLTICDDVVRKLMPFTASNDPVTRALTLRLFGTLSRITREHIGVHHAVLKEIESHYAVECDAAIWSSHQLAPLSSCFAVNLCPILCQRLVSLSTDLDVKLKLIRLGKHMHHDIDILEQIRRCLVEMLAVYGTCEFVSSILDTLTTLESFAPIHSSDQLDLLIDYLDKDDRPPVRKKALQSLVLLAHCIPHYWESKHITKLCSHYLSSGHAPHEREDILHCFHRLVCSGQAVGLVRACSGGVVQCVKIALSLFPATRLTLRAFQLACKLVTLPVAIQHSEPHVGSSASYNTLSPGQLFCFLVAHFAFRLPSASDNADEGYPLHWYLTSDEISLAELKHTYILLVQFFDAFPEHGFSVSKMDLFKHVRLDGDSRVAVLCQFLSTLAAHSSSEFQSNTFMNKYTSANLLSQVGSHVARAKDGNVCSVLPACGLIFQLSEGVFLKPQEQLLLLSHVAKVVNGSDAIRGNQLPPWLAYQLGRQANRYGQHDLAAIIYENLIPLTLSEKTSYWIRGLAEFSRAEALLIRFARSIQFKCPPRSFQKLSIQTSWIDELTVALRRAADIICRTRTLFICVGSPDTRWFQAEYVGIRSELYLCLAELCCSARHQTRVSQWSAQVPAMKSDSGESSHKEDVTAQSPSVPPIWVLRQLEMWNALKDRLSVLQAQCLDADEATHGHLVAIAQLARFFIHVLESLQSIHDPSTSSPTFDTLSTKQIRGGDPFTNILPELNAYAQSERVDDPSHMINFDWLSYLSLRVAQLASHWPRFFFQRLQTTTVRLVLLPKAGGGPDDVLTIGSGVGHMVQVMGVVQQRCSRLPECQLTRRIQAVEIELTVTEAAADLHRSVRTHKKRHCGNIVFYSRRSARLQRDYFHCEFCVQFPSHPQPQPDPQRRHVDRIYCIQATTILVDASETQWRLTHVSGAPKETTLVRVETICASVPATVSHSGSLSEFVTHSCVV